MAFRGGIWIHASIHLWFWGSFFWPPKDEPIFGFESFCSLPNTRKLEDKLIQHHIEFRSFFLPMDLNGLHHNRDMPAGFTLYLCVSDATLPSKGTAHRANRGASKAGDGKHKCFYHNISPGVPGSNTFIPPSKSSKVEKEDVNCFASSKLWQSQLVSSAPRAIDESEFIIPGCNAIVSSAEGRRNYTDLQETAQWIGGTEIPKLILKDLLQ